MHGKLRLAALGFVLLICSALVGCGPTPGPTTSPSPTTCTPSGAASSNWPAASATSGPKPAITGAAISGNSLKFTFGQGTPQFEVKPQSSAHFVMDPSGKPIDLPGSAGAVIVLRGFRGDVANYTPSLPLASGGPLLLQVNKIGDSEGVISWAAGLSGPGCAYVTAAASTLTFQFISH